MQATLVAADRHGNWLSPVWMLDCRRIGVACASSGDGGVDSSRQMLLQKNIDDRAIIDYSINIPIRVYECEVGHTIHNVFG